MSDYHINKAIRHCDCYPIALLLNHLMGVKGGAGEERRTDSTPRTIKKGRLRVKKKMCHLNV